MLWPRQQRTSLEKTAEGIFASKICPSFRSSLTPRRRLGSTWTGAQWGRWLRLLQRSRTLLWGRMRRWQPCRPPDWAGRGKSCAIPGSAEHSGQQESSLDKLPRWRRQGKEGRRASPSSTAPESGAFTPSSLPYCFRHLVKDPPRYPHSIVSSTVQGRRPGAPLTFPQEEKGFKRNVWRGTGRRPNNDMHFLLIPKHISAIEHVPEGERSKWGNQWQGCPAGTQGCTGQSRLGTKLLQLFNENQSWVESENSFDMIRFCAFPSCKV